MGRYSGEYVSNVVRLSLLRHEHSCDVVCVSIDMDHKQIVDTCSYSVP